jgi:hypothetical protein
MSQPYTPDQALELWYAYLESGRLKSAGPTCSTGQGEGVDEAARVYFHVEGFFSVFPFARDPLKFVLSGREHYRWREPGEDRWQAMLRNKWTPFIATLLAKDDERVARWIAQHSRLSFDVWYAKHPLTKIKTFEVA